MRNALRPCDQTAFTVMYLYDEKSLWQTESSVQKSHRSWLQRWKNRKRSLSFCPSVSLCLSIMLSESKTLKTTSTREQKQSGVKFVFYIEHTLGGKIEPWTSNIKHMNLWEQVTLTWPPTQTGSVRIRSVWDTLKHTSESLKKQSQHAIKTCSFDFLTMLLVLLWMMHLLWACYSHISAEYSRQKWASSCCH